MVWSSNTLRQIYGGPFSPFIPRFDAHVNSSMDKVEGYTAKKRLENLPPASEAWCWLLHAIIYFVLANLPHPPLHTLPTEQTVCTCLGYLGGRLLGNVQ